MPAVTANGIRIGYEERGEGEALILIMGLGADRSKWDDHVQAYAQHFRCILMDNRGAGESDTPDGPYTTAMMAEDTVGLMAALGIARAHVAGISMGSAIAQEMALRHPEKVRSLLLVSSWARCDAYPKAIFEHFYRLREDCSPDAFMQLLQLWIFTPQHYNQHDTDMAQGQQDALQDPMPQQAFMAQCQACMTHDTLDRLSQIQQPTLITVGDADIFTPLRFAEEIQQRLPQSQLLVLPGLGHAHHWEDLETFNQRTLAFLLEQTEQVGTAS